MGLQDFIKKPYPIVINEDQGKFQLFDPKLHIFVESDSLQSSYELYQAEKIKFYRRLESIESLHLIPSLSSSQSFGDKFDFKKIFIERFFSFIFTLVFWVLLLSILVHQVSKTTKKINEAFVPVTPERSEVRLERFKEKLQVVAPYMKEVKKAFNE